MKQLMLLFVLFSSVCYGQSKRGEWNEPIKIGDSLELKSSNDSILFNVVDTLPIFTLDESSGWRDMRLVKYYYDSSRKLKKIDYRHGQQGYYYFYFDGPYLRKVRVIKNGGRINLQYYFSDEDNQHSSTEIEQKGKANPDLKEFYEVLMTAQTFVTKFKDLL